MSEATTVEPVARRRPSRRAVVVAAIAVVVLVVGVLLFVRWRNGLRLFPEGGDDVGADQVAVGRTFYSPEVWSPVDTAKSLEITSATPQVSTNSARAEVRTLACTLKPGPSLELGTDWSLRHWCGSVRPFRSGRYRLSGDSPTDGAVVLVVAITPRAAGHVHVTGVHLQYEQGLRRGDQLVGFEIDTKTK